MMTPERSGGLQLWTYDAKAGDLRMITGAGAATAGADLTVWPQGCQWATDGTIYAFASPSSSPLSGYRLVGLRPEVR